MHVVYDQSHFISTSTIRLSSIDPAMASTARRCSGRLTGCIDRLAPGLGRKDDWACSARLMESKDRLTVTLTRAQVMLRRVSN
jgi:hypothetical protein